MAEEVLLEVVDEVYGLLEELLILAAVHEDGLCAKHLWHLGEDAGSALCYQPVGELAYQWIAGDAAESIGATALQADAQFAHRYVLTLVFLRFLVEVAENVHAHLQFVAFDLLGDEQLDAVLVVVAKHLHESVWLVVLTTQ